MVSHAVIIDTTFQLQLNGKKNSS